MAEKRTRGGRAVKDNGTVLGNSDCLSAAIGKVIGICLSKHPKLYSHMAYLRIPEMGPEIVALLAELKRHNLVHDSGGND